jgi:beta-phosphoglucomutase-like phosphatase (HAD superfamily)
MTNPSFTYKTGAQCHARINQLEALLSLSLSAEEPLIDKAWLRITELEKMLEDKPTSAPPARSTPSKATTQLAAKADPSATPLYGIERAAAALREGRTNCQACSNRRRNACERMGKSGAGSSPTQR